MQTNNKFLPTTLKEIYFIISDQLKGIRDYEIIVPQRLDKWGHHFPPEQQYLRRQKRSTSPDLSIDQSDALNNSQSNSFDNSQSESFHDHPKIYDFEAYGRTFSLELRPDVGFVSPNVVIQYLDGDYTVLKNITHVLDTDCFHTGSVRGVPGSSVHLSVCHSLVSTPLFVTLYIWCLTERQMA